MTRGGGGGHKGSQKKLDNCMFSPLTTSLLKTGGNNTGWPVSWVLKTRWVSWMFWGLVCVFASNFKRWPVCFCKVVKAQGKGREHLTLAALGPAHIPCVCLLLLHKIGVQLVFSTGHLYRQVYGWSMMRLPKKRSLGEENWFKNKK